jgi:hypothetical protein
VGTNAAVAGVTAVAAGLLAWQLFLPPVVGLADNNDFPKVAGYFSLGNDPADRFLHLSRVWRKAPEFAWDSGFRTTEHLHVWAARDRADIRWVGLTHALVMLAAIALLARRVGWRALLALPILLDLTYSAYFNSMYMDAAAIVWLSLALAAFLNRLWPVYLVASVAFLCSKSIHALSGLVLVAATLGACWPRWSRVLVAGAQLGAAGWSLSRITPDYSAQAVYNLLFTKLAQHGSDADLLSVGVRPDELRWKGTTAYDPGAPARDFEGRVSHLDLAKLYVGAPWIPLRFAWSDLTLEAPHMRPMHLGNFERSSGAAAGEKAGGPLAWWGWARSRTMPLVPIFYAVCLWVFRRNRGVAMAAWCMGVAEFGIASLADACETSRHLVLFHYLTDVLVVLLAMGSESDGPAQTGW